MEKTATIGCDTWKNASVRNIRLGQTVVNRSDKACDMGQQLDPLPSLRDTSIQQSNARIHAYVRATRAVLVKLQENLLDTNEEIKSLIKGKETLEKTLEHIRKDIVLNNKSTSIRKTRPPREKSPDGADDLLTAERKHLLKLKRILEAQLRSAQKQLQVLDANRKRLRAAVQERSRVMDLICHAVSSVRGAGIKDQIERPSTPEVEPLGPYTPECARVISEAADARQRSSTLRKEVAEAIEQTIKLQKAAHNSVNDGLTQKVAETVSVRQHLQVGGGELRMSIHRSKRWYNATEMALGYTLGPVAYSDLTTREHLDRPTVKIFQRHPGNQLPEAREIGRGGQGLQESLNATARNIGLLKLTKDRIDSDASDKHHASLIDSNVVRDRRRHANHRWVLTGIGY
ncbi:coiled-coil domain-containing protein 105 [Nematostella vectensis]|uniref:coiled-coil domain-containing protein 105 n=1 Tax=Nematostella vectensis TaxID=45351 RepID=UPI002077866C|nr:coiled-coil domain-containing protein 105 [Nematostella vectensis]